ncbi:MAG TPA: hypothetical protein VFT99_10645, partial [Roseiflexaceae bacterium]|nr:hypothetical protein [Roseiflexaceae bacterium]
MRVSLYVCVSLALLWQLSVAWQGYSNAQGNTRAYLPLVLGGNALVAPTPNPTPNPTPTPSEGWLAYVNK